MAATTDAPAADVTASASSAGNGVGQPAAMALGAAAVPRTEAAPATRVAGEAAHGTGGAEESRGAQVQVVSGLEAGQTVVIAGQQRLQRDGTPVRVVDMNKPAAPGGQGLGAGGAPRAPAG